MARARVGGFVVGYVIKKISKQIVILLGFLFLFLLYLGSSGIININYDKLLEAIGNGLGLTGQAVQWIVGIISILPFAGSFFAGFFLGFKMG